MLDPPPLFDEPELLLLPVEDPDLLLLFELLLEERGFGADFRVEDPERGLTADREFELDPLELLGFTVGRELELEPLELLGLTVGLTAGLDRSVPPLLGLTLLPSRRPVVPPFQILGPLERGSTGLTRGLAGDLRVGEESRTRSF